MDKKQRQEYFQSNPHRKWIWVTVIVLQATGLGMILVAMPIQLISVLRQFLPHSLQLPQDDRTIFFIVFCFFSLLACINILAVIGICRLNTWVRHYIIVKLAIAILVSLCVPLFHDYPILFISLPLLCSLAFMTWAYRRLMKIQPTAQAV